MSTHPLDDLDPQTLRATVQAIWLGQGRAAPEGEDLARAVAILRDTMALGRAVPRNVDKTSMPMYGARRDIE